MGEETKKEPEQPQKEGWKEKVKKFFKKTDDLIDEKVEQVKKTKVYEDVKQAAKKAEDFVEDKIEDIKESGIKEKLNEFADKAESEAKEHFGKAKEFGKKVAGKTADKLDDIAENLRKKSQDGTEAKAEGGDEAPPEKT